MYSSEVSQAFCCNLLIIIYLFGNHLMLRQFCRQECSLFGMEITGLTVYRTHMCYSVHLPTGGWQFSLKINEWVIIQEIVKSGYNNMRIE